MQAENLAQAANLIWGFDPKVIATAIVVVCYIILFTEKLNRAVVALLGACVMIFSGILTQGNRPAGNRLQYHLPAGRNDDHCRHFGKIRYVPICGHLGCSES